tara:strand:+ start:2872 stop:3336 length:465 start_codon:yes stop_codon:yes gene_type:complete
MEQNKFNKYFLILISFFVICSCQFEWVEERRIYLKKIEFGLSVSDAFKQKSIKYFSQDSSNNNYILNISNLQFKKKNFYGGYAARAQQIEIIGQLEYSFSNMASTNSGKLEISGWIPVNENNPQAEMTAQQKMIEELESLLLEDLLQEYWLIES